MFSEGIDGPSGGRLEKCGGGESLSVVGIIGPGNGAPTASRW